MKYQCLFLVIIFFFTNNITNAATCSCGQYIDTSCVGSPAKVRPTCPNSTTDAYHVTTTTGYDCTYNSSIPSTQSTSTTCSTNEFINGYAGVCASGTTRYLPSCASGEIALRNSSSGNSFPQGNICCVKDASSSSSSSTTVSSCIATSVHSNTACATGELPIYQSSSSSSGSTVSTLVSCCKPAAMCSACPVINLYQCCLGICNCTSNGVSNSVTPFTNSITIANESQVQNLELGQSYKDSETNTIATVLCKAYKLMTLIITPVFEIGIVILGFAAFQGKLRPSIFITITIAFAAASGVGSVIEKFAPGNDMNFGCQCATTRTMPVSVNGKWESLSVPTGLNSDCTLISVVGRR